MVHSSAELVCIYIIYCMQLLTETVQLGRSARSVAQHALRHARHMWHKRSDPVLLCVWVAASVPKVWSCTGTGVWTQRNATVSYKVRTAIIVNILYTISSKYIGIILYSVLAKHYYTYLCVKLYIIRAMAFVVPTDPPALNPLPIVSCGN